MTKNPTIPMTPGARPTQYLNEVVSIEPRPDPFDFLAGYDVVPKDMRPKGPPRAAIYLGQVEWAWSPMHNRIDAYYLHRGRSLWILWTRYWDDNWGQWGWMTVACVPKRDITQRQAAVHLLLEYWKELATEDTLDHYHWINEEASLSVSDLTAIAREVWGDQCSAQ